MRVGNGCTQFPSMTALVGSESSLNVWMTIARVATRRIIKREWIYVHAVEAHMGRLAGEEGEVGTVSASHLEH